VLRRVLLSSPRISINIPILNEERRIGVLLESIRIQRYPQDKVEILVVDGGSSDRSREIARAFRCKILENPHGDQESGKRIGARAATGDLHMYLDADMEWSHDQCLRALVLPWLEEDSLAASFPRYAVDPRDPPLNRYLSYHPLYQDPLMRFLSARIEDAVVERKHSYALCDFGGQRTPIIGIALFATAFVREMIEASDDDWAWSDVDFAVEAALRGQRFAFVPSASLFHRSAMTRSLHLSKLRRNVRGTYIPNVAHRRAVYAEWNDPRQVLRLALWVLYANLVLPGVVTGLAKALRHRDVAFLYEPWAITVGTDYVVWQFLRDPEGKRLLGRALTSMLAATGPAEAAA
jgi:glycosyltransferase involved in cell wall biosynthesis